MFEDASQHPGRRIPLKRIRKSIYQQLSGVRSGKGLFRGKKNFFLFERKRFGRGGEFSSFLDELGLQFLQQQKTG